MARRVDKRLKEENKPIEIKSIENMENRYGTPYASLFCLLTAFNELYIAGDDDAEKIEKAVKKAGWYFDYADAKGAPMLDMSYWSLIVDVRRMINVAHRTLNRLGNGARNSGNEKPDELMEQE